MIYITMCGLLSGAASYLGQPSLKDNSDAVTVLITVMTVFAGFLVAIIAVLGDPAMIPKGSWRVAEKRHRNLESALIRHTWLFYTYLAAIALLFIGILIRKDPSGAGFDWLKRWIEYLYLFFGIFSFLLTLSLPSALARLQLARSAQEIEQRRAEVGIGKDAERRG